MRKKHKDLEYEISILRDQLEKLSIFTINLIHEVEILKESLFSKGTLSPKQWGEYFQDIKKKLVWNKKGWGSDSEHLRRYSRDKEEWSRQLFPDLSDKKRQETIEAYEKDDL